MGRAQDSRTPGAALSPAMFASPPRAPFTPSCTGTDWSRPRPRPRAPARRCHQARSQRALVRRLKGECKRGNGEYCYPLTVTDHDSRYPLPCEARVTVESDAITADQQLASEAGKPSSLRQRRALREPQSAVKPLQLCRNIADQGEGQHHGKRCSDHDEKNHQCSAQVIPLQGRSRAYRWQRHDSPANCLDLGRRNKTRQDS